MYKPAYNILIDAFRNLPFLQHFTNLRQGRTYVKTYGNLTFLNKNGII